MDSRKPLTAGEIEELREALRAYDEKQTEHNFRECAHAFIGCGQSLLSLLTPPPDAAVPGDVGFLKVVTDLTRRLADAERRGDTWKVQANKNCQDMGLISKRLEDALARVRELEEVLGSVGAVHKTAVEQITFALRGAGDRVRELEAEEEERKAGWQLAGDAARGLRVECDGDLGHEAEQIRAERDDLQAFNARVMAWALGRCECCEHSNAAGQGIPHVSKTCRECCNSDGTPNWTPLKEWEVRP